MKKKRSTAFLNWILLALLAFSLVLDIKVIFSSAAIAQANSNLLVSAAASLKESLENAKQIYRQVNPIVAVNYNFGASGTLQLN